MKLFLPLILVLVSFKAGEAVNPSAEDLLSTEVETYVQQHYSGKAVQTEAEIRWIPEALTGNPDVRIEDVTLAGSGNPRGYETFKVTYRDNGRSRNARIQAYVRVFQEVAVADRQIRRGDDINEANISIRQKDLSRFNRMPADLSGTEGLVAASTVREGTILTDRHIRRTPVVDSGDQLSMQYQNGGLQITLSVRARQSGATGETIRVDCNETRKTYKAEVVSGGELKWKGTL